MTSLPVRVIVKVVQSVSPSASVFVYVNTSVIPPEGKLPALHSFPTRRPSDLIVKLPPASVVNGLPIVITSPSSSSAAVTVAVGSPSLSLARISPVTAEPASIAVSVSATAVGVKSLSVTEIVKLV